MKISADQIKKLRELTGAGILDTKLALEEHKGDFTTQALNLPKKHCRFWHKDVCYQHQTHHDDQGGCYHDD